MSKAKSKAKKAATGAAASAESAGAASASPTQSRPQSPPAESAGQPSPAPLPGWTTAIPFLLPLIVYFYTAAPGITFVDSGELSTSIWTLGIPHPPGTPVYVLLGHLFSLLPLSADIARRTNLFSAFCCAGTVGFSYLLTRDFFEDLDPRLAMAGSIAFAFSTGLWSWAVVTEVYALNILLLTITLWLAARGQWIWTCFFAGLALGVHHATIVAALPAVAHLAWVSRPPEKETPRARDFVLSAAAGVAGLSAYLYLLIRARQHPLFNWGDPSTLERWWWHLSGKQYLLLVKNQVTIALAGRIWECVKLAAGQITPAGLVVAAAGFALLWRRDRVIFEFTTLLVGLNIAFVIVTGLGGPDIQGYYLPAYLAGSWCFALGADEIRKRLGILAGIPVIALLTLLPLIFNFTRSNHHDDQLAPLYVENTLRGVPAGSFVFTSDWNFSAPYIYDYFVLGNHREVTVVDIVLLQRPWYIDLLKRDHPDAYQFAAKEFASYVQTLDLAEHGKLPEWTPVDQAFAIALTRLGTAALDAGRPVYFTADMRAPIIKRHSVAPHGLLTQYADGTEDVELDLTGLTGELYLDQTALTVRDTYALTIGARAAYLAAHKDYDGALHKIDLSLMLNPKDEQVLRMKQVLERATQR